MLLITISVGVNTSTLFNAVYCVPAYHFKLYCCSSGFKRCWVRFDEHKIHICIQFTYIITYLGSETVNRFVTNDTFDRYFVGTRTFSQP